MSKFPKFEFHVSRAARDLYRFDDTLFSITGNVIFANFAATREFAHRMNQLRDAAHHPERAVNAGALNVMGLIDEILHGMVAHYRQAHDPRAMTDALDWFSAKLGAEALARTLHTFADRFPTVAVYRKQQTAAEWLRGTTGGVPNRAIALEEMLLLWLENANPAFDPFAELFDDSPLAIHTAYPTVAIGFHDYFETRPRFGPGKLNLIDVLRAPALASPKSLAGQLEFIRGNWTPYIGDALERMMTALDVLKEEETATWMLYHPPTAHFGGAQTQFMQGDSSAAAIPHYTAEDARPHEYEAFTPDVDWMPKTVMIAKTVYVWLHQLSKQYGRAINTLDQVPDEELDAMARRGFNALWLIGIWERSSASQKIKQLMGNAEAVASAYSLHDYTFANDLGGEHAYSNLRDRAMRRGIRLASDMVPNHMGIDSRWVIEHPERFISLPYPPYPAYSFDGPDLSNDNRVEIKIEDHYYQRTDAAVVFRRVDRWSGETRYVYHGNDGTSFPWNDTAQLDYLRADVREAVIQTILEVARRFPIIRFDAAMTLTKLHYQRLWFPMPGTGGAIPSRAEHGMTKAAFDAVMPAEFWREVVDRVAAEVPGTLLLAEAFWLLEGYFVRTLGVHRVYNSAFMNMLRDEENANYRSVIKNTLEFDPEVLKRHVNFMNNPDERTAVDQFGKGDKYFGTCTLLATLPGLPMFGHGQIEGYAERYGMEYRRAYHDEHPDSWLVARHEREITPLLHRRALFAEVRDFLLYDFFTDSGRVNEDVYAYSNRLGDQRGLVVYNNRFSNTTGWIRTSAAYCEKTGDGKQLRQRTIGDALGMTHDPAMFVAYRDSITGLEYLGRAADISDRGLRIELGAYKYHVFMDWRDVHEVVGGLWGKLCDSLNGRGVSSLDDEMRMLELKPVHNSLHALLEPALIESLAKQSATAGSATAGTTAAKTKGATTATKSKPPKAAIATSEFSKRMRLLIQEVSNCTGREGCANAGVQPPRGTLDGALALFDKRLTAVLELPSLEQQFSAAWPPEARALFPASKEPAKTSLCKWGALVACCTLEALGELQDPDEPNRAATLLFEVMRLREQLGADFTALGCVGDENWRAAARIRAVFAHPDFYAKPQEPATATKAKSAAPLNAPEKKVNPQSWLDDPDVAWLIGVHEYEGVRYMVKEPYEQLLWWMSLRQLLDAAETKPANATTLREIEDEVKQRASDAASAGYNIEKLFA